jgi:hypothetical protein
VPAPGQRWLHLERIAYTVEVQIGAVALANLQWTVRSSHPKTEWCACSRVTMEGSWPSARGIHLECQVFVRKRCVCESSRESGGGASRIVR